MAHLCSVGLWKRPGLFRGTVLFVHEGKTTLMWSGATLRHLCRGAREVRNFRLDILVSFELKGYPLSGSLRGNTKVMSVECVKLRQTSPSPFFLHGLWVSGESGRCPKLNREFTTRSFLSGEEGLFFSYDDMTLKNNDVKNHWSAASVSPRDAELSPWFIVKFREKP